MKIHWEPQTKQIKALERPDFEILYGGSRGGGKTEAGQAWLLYDISHPKLRALVIRRNSDDLKDWMDRARIMYAPCGAVFVGNPAEIRFPSGAKIRSGHLKDEGAYTKYQGHEYQRILIEEVTHIPSESLYEKLLGSCRSTVPELRPQVFLTTNPDGDGHYWVKERFDCENPDEKPRFFTDEATGITKSRIFIPAKVEDNKYLIENDPGYVAYLNSIKDPVLRRQWRDGSWVDPNVEGAYYADLMRKAKDEGRIGNFPHQEGFTVDTWWDIGRGDANAIWFTQYAGREIHLIDYLEDEGQGLTYYAKELKRQSDKNGYLYGTHYFPHDMAIKEYSTNVTRIQKATDLGLKPNKIVPKIGIEDGINAVRDILGRCYFNEKTCKDGIRALKNYRKERDEKRDVYRNTPLHNWASHGSDAMRYLTVGVGKFIEASIGASVFKPKINRRV